MHRSDVPRSPRSLRDNRDFAVLWSGEAVSELGSSMTGLVMPLVAYAISASTTQAGLVGSVSLASTLLWRLPAGALVDRWRRDRVLVGANLLGALLFASVAVAAWLQALTIGHLLLVAAVSGAAEAFHAPAMSAAVRTVVPEEQRPTAYSLLQARGHGASLAGPPLGGLLYAAGRAVPFVLDAASFAVAAVSVRFLRTPLPAPDLPPESVGRRIGAGLRFVWGTRVVRALMLWGGLLNLAMGMVWVTVLLRLLRAGVHPAAIGVVEGVSAAAGLVGALVAPPLVRRARTGRLTVVTGVLIGVELAFLSLTTSPWLTGALLAAGTFLMPANNAGISAYLAFVVPDEMQGRMNAAAGFVAGGLAPLGPVLAGALLATVGGVVTTLVGAALVVTSVAPILATPSARDLGRPDQWRPAAGAPD